MTADPAGSLARRRLRQLIFALLIATGVLIGAALIPAICAVPYVPRRHLPRYFVGTLVSEFVCAALALPLIASVNAPTVVKYLATLGFPAITAPILLVVWHTATTMREMAIIARRSADALRSSQRLLAERADQLTASRARLVAATDDIRRLAQSIYPPLLARDGLPGALPAAHCCSPSPIPGAASTRQRSAAGRG